MFSSRTHKTHIEPRWPQVLAILAIFGLYWSVPKELWPLGISPSYMGSVMLILAGISLYAHHTDEPEWNQASGYVLSTILTISLILSVDLLVKAALSGAVDSKVLLKSAAFIWITNVIVFALWYWRIDSGARLSATEAGHTRHVFLFPQMTIDMAERKSLNCEDWSPGFVDYLFLAFNTSTALSPADTSVLKQSAKVLFMLQALISITIIAFLAARAVNVLPTPDAPAAPPQPTVAVKPAVAVTPAVAVKPAIAFHVRTEWPQRA